MVLKARFATVHRMRFAGIRTAEMLGLQEQPEAALSWKIGPAGELGPDGYRLPAPVWCAVGLYADQDAATGAMETRKHYMPFLGEALEEWSAVLLPVVHKGQCNHLERDRPDALYEVSGADPGGRLVVITTAGFVPGPDFSVERVIFFRRNVDAANEWMGKAEGCLANQVFTPHTTGDDGVTMTVWRDDAAMMAAAYRPGTHRSQMERHFESSMMDRSSFTRFRVLASYGDWSGRDPARV